jgi:hypothetical protein
MAEGGGELMAFQRWSVAEGVADVNPVHGLGTAAGIAFEVPPGGARTLVLAIGCYLDGVVTTGAEAKYLYTRYYSGLEDVLDAALRRSDKLRDRAARLDVELLSSGLSAHQMFLVAHGTRGYYGSTQLLDLGGEPLYVVNEGEYCMMNTLDLAIDQAFWELQRNPWVVRNILDAFVRHYSYHDQVKLRGGGSAGGKLAPGGISFAHDMGVNNNFSPPGHSSYELPHLKGCFSYMTIEQLCNWLLLAECYVAATGDREWLTANEHVLAACGRSLRARCHPRTGVPAFDSARCGPDGQEITTYDSLDESLGQARANSYLAVKVWAAWLGLQMIDGLRGRAAAGADGHADGAIAADAGTVADVLADHLLASVDADGTIPGVLEPDNPGAKSRTLPIVEGLIYPAYWARCLADDPTMDSTGDVRAALSAALTGPLAEALRRHVLRLLTDPARRNLFADGGIKLSSTSDNSWASKIALFQHVARQVLKLPEHAPEVSRIFADADAAHARWQTDGSGYWACSDQFVNGEARGSRYYPRIITTALWLTESRDSIARPEQPKAAAATATE